MAHFQGVLVGVADSAGISGARALHLRGRQVPKNVEVAFVLVDGDTQEAERLSTVLQADATQSIPTGSEGTYAERLLGEGSKSAAVALLIHDDLVIAARAKCRAYSCASRAFVDTPSGNSEVRTATFSAWDPKEPVALLMGGALDFVTEQELHDSLCTGFSSFYTPNDAASWVASLTTGRGGDASVLVLTRNSASKANQRSRREGFWSASAPSAERRQPTLPLLARSKLAASSIALRFRRLQNLRSPTTHESRVLFHRRQTGTEKLRKWQAGHLLFPFPFARRKEREARKGNTSRIARSVLAGAIVLAAGLVVVHPPITRTQSAAPTPVSAVSSPSPSPIPTATRLSVSQSKPTVATRPSIRPQSTPTITALPAWDFPAVPQAKGPVVIALYNPSALSVLARVRVAGMTGLHDTLVRVPPQGTTKLNFSRQVGVPAITVRVTSPIVPTRLIVSG